MSEHSTKYSIVNPLTFAEVEGGYYRDRGSMPQYDLNVKVLTRRFKRLFEGLQANIKAKTSISKRGKLKGSRLWRYKFDPKLFTKVDDRHSDFDLSFVFLMDVSGSMSSSCSDVQGKSIARLTMAKAVMKAMVDSLKGTLKGKVGVEILLKSCPEANVDNYGNPGFLSRVYSSFITHLDSDIIDQIGYANPIITNTGDGTGSSTPELLLGKGIKYFLDTQLMTKSYIVVNLTDGGTYCGMRAEEYEGWWGSFGSDSNKKAIKKYFKNVPFVSIMIGEDKPSNPDNDMGYPNPVYCSDSKFAVRLENIIKKVVESVVE